MSYDHLIVELKDNITHISLNDPSTMNAISGEMALELKDALRAAGRTSNAVILTGNARAFCSGANLSVRDGLAPGQIDAGAMLDDVYNPLVLTIRTLPIPLITAVQGAAAGIGASLALMGDIIVAGENAYFLMPFRHIGLIPDGGAAWLLTRAIGRARALDMMLMGEKIPAKQAYDWGLISRFAPDDQVLETAQSIASNLAQGATQALALTRKATWAALSSSFEDGLRLEREYQREAGYHPDFAEGVAAFQEKRPANFGSTS